MPRPEPATVIEVEREEHEIERSSHALYGLVIITATLVAELEAATDAMTSLLVLWGAGIVLLLAHLYAAAVAQAGERGRWLSHVERHLLIADNIPVLAALVVPSILIALAGAGVLDLAVAIDISIVGSIAALFAVGAYQAHRQGASRALQLGIGILGSLTGLIVILLEVVLSH
jgi:tellurite resistance protein TehA-like permease